MQNYTIKSNYYKKYYDECIKIPRKYKHSLKELNNKKNILRNNDSKHSNKNMRSFGKDWKNYNQNIYII